MTVIEDLFDLYSARSRGFDSYPKGSTPFVTNGFQDNGIVGFVTPRQSDRVFNFCGICVSCFGEATVHTPPFLARGNGGSGLVVLEPKKPMSYNELLTYAAYINSSIRWRFSYGRMVTRDRFAGIPIEPQAPVRPIRSVKELLLPKPTTDAIGNVKIEPVPISTIFNVSHGKGEYLEDLRPGSTPLVSATGQDNGILGYVDLEPTFEAPAITVERVGGQAFVQIQDFATVPADISVLVRLTEEPNVEALFFIAHSINRERWRFSYGLKLTVGRLENLRISLPVTSQGAPDYGVMQRAVKASYGWDAIRKRFESFRKAGK